VESEEFVRRMQAKDPTLFNDLMPILTRVTQGVCTKRGVFGDRREDIVQDVAIKVLQRGATFLGLSQFTSWLHTVADNTVLDALGLAQAQNEHTTADPDDPVLGEGAKPLWAATANSNPNQRLCVGAVIEELEREPPARKGSMRKIDLLRYWVEKSPTYAELAAHLGTSEAAARQRMHYLREELSKLCKHHCGNGDCSLDQED
jgi:RNA polymerase sigma factor (sigma-70 family)